MVSLGRFDSCHYRTMKSYVLDRMASEVVTIQGLAFSGVLVTKKVLAEKIQVSEMTLSNDFKDLISKGIITMNGNRRTASYVLTERTVEALNTGKNINSLIESSTPIEKVSKPINRRNIEVLKSFRDLLQRMEDLEAENELQKEEISRLQGELKSANDKFNKLRNLL